MRALCIALTASAALAASTAYAHGPQIQLTRNSNQITTRRISREEPYAARLSAPTSVYVIPLLETGGVWYSRPNNQPSATLPGLPEYLSGPGIAYGYDQALENPPNAATQAFAAGRHFELRLTDGLKWWNGSTFVDPGAEQIEAFRSSGLPAVTSDSLTPTLPATLLYGNVASNYAAEVHSGASFRLLGNGTSPTAPSDDGVYLMRMVYASNEPGLAASEPFYFLLHKNAANADIAAAASSLGFATSSVQFVPEPGVIALAVSACAATLAWRRRRDGRMRR